MKRIRVLHVIKSLGRGGAEMLLAETLKLHDRQKFEFRYIYFLPWKDQMVESLKTAGGIVHCFSARNNLEIIFKWRRVVRYIRQNDIDIVHAHLPWAGFMSRLIYVTSRLPVIYTEHNKQERYHWLTFFLNRLTFNWQSLAIAVSDDVRESIKKNINPSVPISLVVNGVNTDMFQRNVEAGLALRAKLGIPAGVPVIGTVAVFRAQKRLLEWVNIAMDISGRNKKAYFVMVGDGPLKDQIEARRNLLGLEQRLFMPGLQSDVKSWLSMMDLYMVTSKFEGLPVALLEAMSMECAIITTDAGGIKEVVRNNVDGLVCEVESVEKLTEFAMQLTSDESRRRQLAMSARRRIIESFSLNRLVSALQNTYELELRK